MRVGRHLLVIVNAAIALAGCHRVPTPQAVPTESERRLATGVGFEELEARLPEGAAATQSREGFLAHREARTERLVLPAGCMTIAAQSAPGVRDLDLAAYESDGRLLAEDTQPDAHPTLQLCLPEDPAAPAAGKVVWIHVAAYAGAGAYALQVYPHARDQVDAYASATGGRPGQWFGESGEEDSAEVRRGFDHLDGRMRLAIAPDRDTEVALPLRAGRCISARIEADVTVHLALRQGAGHRRAAPGTEPGIQLCATEDEDATLVVRAAEQEGVVTLIMRSGSAARIGGRAGLWRATPVETGSEAASENAAPQDSE